MIICFHDFHLKRLVSYRRRLLSRLAGPSIPGNYLLDVTEQCGRAPGSRTEDRHPRNDNQNCQATE